MQTASPIPTTISPGHTHITIMGNGTFQIQRSDAASLVRTGVTMLEYLDCNFATVTKKTTARYNTGYLWTIDELPE
jgi:hypothetical protein